MCISRNDCIKKKREFKINWWSKKLGDIKRSNGKMSNSEW